MSLVSSMLTTIKRVNCDKVHEVPEKFKHAIVGLNDEMGELNEVLKRAMYYGDPIDDDNILEEYGDMMYYIILDCMRIAKNKKMSEEQVFAAIFSINSAKLKVRYPDYFSEAQATAKGRNLEAEKKAMAAPSSQPDLEDLSRGTKKKLLDRVRNVRVLQIEDEEVIDDG